MASVARTRSNEADGAVQVLAVIPAGEGFHPGLGVCLCGKALSRPVRAIFAGSEERLGERIVIADARAAVGPLCQGSCPLLYFSLFFRWAG